MLDGDASGGNGGTAVHRPRFVVAVATAAMLLIVAACGGSSGAPSPSATSAPTEAPAPTDVPASESPSAAAVESPSSAATATTAAAKCGGIAIRQDPMSDGKVIVRVKAGGKVRVVATVTGDAYQGGSCGTSGSDWLKVDRVNGKSIKVQYGVPFGYVAAGFFQ